MFRLWWNKAQETTEISHPPTGLHMGDDYCEQKLWVVVSGSTGKFMVVIADSRKEAMSMVEELLGCGPYRVWVSDVVSGVVVVGEKLIRE